MLDSNKLKEAVHALLQYNTKLSEGNKDIFNSSAESKIYVQFSLKKPLKSSKTIIYCRLPHRTVPENPQICLLHKDLKLPSEDKQELIQQQLIALRLNEAVGVRHTVETVKQRLNKTKCGESIEVFPMMKLRQEFIPFEAKRNLAASFDVFWVDKSIKHHVRNFLGSKFMISAKIPIPLNCSELSLPREVRRAMCTISCIIRGGASTTSFMVGTSSLGEQFLVDNIIEAFNRIVVKIPGGWNNIKTAGVKLHKSPLLPFYIDLTECSAEEAVVDYKKELAVGELSCIPEGSIKVFANGDFEII